MICNDDNKQILPTDASVTIVRRNSAFVYSLPGFSRAPSSPVSGLRRVIDGRIYRYADGVLVSETTGEERECSVGSAIDFHRADGAFYFVRCTVNRQVLVDFSNEELIRFSGPYTFCGRFLYFSEKTDPESTEQTIARFDMLSREKQCIAGIDTAIAHLACRHSEGGDLVAVADSFNNLHVINGTERITYHWHSNKILRIVLMDDYVVAACKDRTVAKFHVGRDEKRILFRALGTFVDLCIHNNCVFFLTRSFFTVYDGGLDRVVYKDILPCVSSYSRVRVEDQTQEPSDVFQLKRRSKIEILNSIEKDTTADLSAPASEEAVGFTCENLAFLITRGGFVAQFLLSHSHNFITGNKLVSVETRRGKVVFHIYTIFSDRLSYADRYEARRIPVEAVYWGESGLYAISNGKVLRVGKLGTAAPVWDAGRVVYDKMLFICDERGVYNADSGAFLVKQKRVGAFCVVNDEPLFSVADRGLYVDRGTRVRIGDADGLVDMASGSDGTFLALRHTPGRKVLAEYRLEGDAMAPVSEIPVAMGCVRIVTRWALETDERQLFVLSESRPPGKDLGP